MRQSIKGIKYHPERWDALPDYSEDVPEGAWTGRLDYHAWGLSTNLFCFFTEEATGEKYRLSVFHSRGHPSNGQKLHVKESGPVCWP